MELYQQKQGESQKTYILNFKLNTEQANMCDRNSNQDPKNMTFGSLIILDRLGRGSTALVFKTQSIRTKQYYAMKVIDKCKSDYNITHLNKQLQIHQLLNHRYIVQFIRHFQDPDNHYILTEYCNKGEITKFLIEPIKYPRVLRIFWQVGLALDYMHNTVGVAHGDIKLSNILISGSDYKLCDFGFSVMLAQGEKEQGKDNTIFGTLLYMSPEILINNSNKYFKESDVWALGICILTLMVQGNPYQAQNPTLLKKKIINGQIVKINCTNFAGYPQQFLDLVSRMLEQDYRKRIKIEQVLKSPIFAKFTQQKQAEMEQTTEKQDNDGNKQNCGDINQIQRRACLETEKEDINKSVFNSTIDTLVDPEDNSIGDNQRIWSYSLKPQKHSTQNNGFIQILNDHTIKVKVEKLEYLISANGSSLQIIKGSKNSKKYTFSQINENKKIKNLFDYGAELVQILKKKQCLREKMIGGIYFWMTKTSVCCLINEIWIIERATGSQQILYRKIGEDLKSNIEEIPEMSQNMLIFSKGVTSFLENVN